MSDTFYKYLLANGLIILGISPKLMDIQISRLYENIFYCLSMRINFEGENEKRSTQMNEQIFLQKIKPSSKIIY